MKISEVITTPIEFYSIVKFPHWFSFGASHPQAYKTITNARKAAQRLINSGDYDLVTIRHETICHRNIYSEVSSSGLIESVWKDENTKAEHDRAYPDMAR